MNPFKFLGIALFAIFAAACQSPLPKESAMTMTIANGTNRAFFHEVQTDASAAEIWRLWSTVDTWKDRDRGLKSATLSGPFEAGVKGTIVPLSGPNSRFEITEVNCNQSYTFETRLPFARLRVERSIVGEEPLIIRHSVSFEGALAGFWAGRFGPGFRQALPPTMDQLIALAELKVEDAS